MQEVRGFESHRLHTLSDVTAADRESGFFLGGLVAGEGSFIVTRKLPAFANGDPRLRFVFQVTMADRDRRLLEDLQAFLKFGSLYDRTARNGRWLPTASFTINSISAHRAATIPFAERYLLPCAKRDQFELWRAALDAFDAAHPNRYGKGPSPCSKPGCGLPVRGRGLCRSHYYRATGY
ncbi:MAG: LAGLIDADG family homing endonuclease [Acidimicrobiales bacterium]